MPVLASGQYITESIDATRLATHATMKNMHAPSSLLLVKKYLPDAISMATVKRGNVKSWISTPQKTATQSPAIIRLRIIPRKAERPKSPSSLYWFGLLVICSHPHQSSFCKTISLFHCNCKIIPFPNILPRFCEPNCLINSQNTGYHPLPIITRHTSRMGWQLFAYQTGATA